MKERSVGWLAEQGFVALLAHLESAAAARRDPLGRFEAMGFGYVAFARAHPGITVNLSPRVRPFLFDEGDFEEGKKPAMDYD